jgi:hypothetical protein
MKTLFGSWAHPLFTPAILVFALFAADAFAQGGPRYLDERLVEPASTDAISHWTAVANAVSAAQQESVRTRARTLAIVNVAMFEAISAVERSDTLHKLNIRVGRNSSIESAAAAAAHDVLVALYPDQAPDLSPALAASLARSANDVPKARGYALGKNTAAEIVALWLSTTPCACPKLRKVEKN